jgi:hypothetical protein
MAQYKPVLLDTDTGKHFYADSNPYDYITTLEYNQDVPFNEWTITHDMNSTKVLIKVLDVSGNEIVPDNVLISDTNNIIITFSTNFAGTAFLYFFG